MMRVRVEVRDGGGKLAEVEVVDNLWEARHVANRVLGATRIECFRPNGKVPVAVFERSGSSRRWLRAPR